MNLTLITSTIQTLSNWYNKATKLGQLVGENSMSDLTKETKVEPLVILSKDCIGIEVISDVMQGVLNYTIADYMQGVALFGRVDDIKVRRALGAFNPNRDGSSGALLASVNLESLTPASMKFSLPIGTVATMEAPEGKMGGEGGGKLNTKDIQEEAKNMSVGKLVEVPFTTTSVDGKLNTINLPIQFRLLASYINSSSMVNMLSSGTDDTGFMSRFERARDGGIRPFLDFILAQDMVEEKRKAMFSDDGRLLQKIMTRASANKRAAIASRTPSLATLANIFVVTEQEVIELENRMGRKLDNEGVREQIFRNVYATTLVVINRQWNTVTFWHRGMDVPSTLEFKQLKASAGGKGPDLMDMLKNFNMGISAF